MDEGELFSRDEVLAGLSAKRSRALLFLIDQYSARRAAAREVGPMSLLGERAAEARELASIEHFAMGREPHRRPTIGEIELAADGWGPLVPRASSIRAGVAALLAERYRLDPGRLPRTTAALGLDTPEVADAYLRQRGEPINGLWTGLGLLDRLRWAASAPGRWLEQTTPLRAAAALTFLLSMGQTVVIVPIAVATVGALAAAVSILVIGLLAISATAAIAEAASRSGEVRFRGGFFGRLVIGGLGPIAGAVPAVLGIVGVVLPTVSALIGLGLLLALLLPVPALLCTLVVGTAAAAVPLRGSRTAASFGGLLSFGLVSIAMLTVLSVLVLILALLDGGLQTPALGPPDGIGIELALGVIIGVLLGSYADPVYTVQIGRIVLPRDPDGRGFVRGSMLGMAAFVVVTAVFSAVVLLTIPAGELAGQAGSALDPLSSEFGAVVTVLAGLIGIGLFGIRLYGNAIALYDFVAERLPGRPPRRVVLGARHGRILLSRRDGVPVPSAVLAYRGQLKGSPVLAISRPMEGGLETRELRLEGRAALTEEEVEIRVLEADEDRLRLELETPMSISYDDADGLVGPGVAETLLAEDGSGALAAWLLRVGGADAAAAAGYLGVTESEARGRLRDLVDAGSVREADAGRYEARLSARRKRGAGLGAEIWDRIGLAAEQGNEVPRTDGHEPAEGAAGPALVTLLCSLPMVSLTALSALLIAAGTGSVSGPLKIAGVICFATISGVLPPLMLFAARRRPDIAGAASGGPFVAVPLLALMVAASLAALILHAAILWDNPFERGLAALAAVTALTAIWFSIRHGSFRPATVIDLREEHDEPGLRVLAERDGSPQSPRLSLGGKELSVGARPELIAEVDLNVEATSAGRGELRISAQNIDALGGSAALPLEVELRVPGGGEARRLDHSGGATVFELGDEPLWTLVFRRPGEEGSGQDAEPTGAVAAAANADGEAGPSPGGRRRRGGGGSPLDRL